MKGRKNRILSLFAAVIAAGGLTGCTRSQLNYQVAECIGTLGQYENNEPVETPKMKADRESRESEEALEEVRLEHLEYAQQLAEGYFYEEAIAYLQNKEEMQDEERAEQAIASYQNALKQITEYEGTIGHLCFTNLVVDTQRAFDGDEYSSIYKSNLITLEEFQGILQKLYDVGYVLIDIHSLAEAQGDSMTQKAPQVPAGKTPLILSVENLNFESMRSADGVPTSLTLDDSEEVAAVYTDAEGHEKKGAYDIVTVLNAFVREHPDFSYRGAKGIISLSGSAGAFGYDLNESSAFDYEENVKMVKSIAQKLTQDGWSFATEGYSYQYMGDMSYETLRNDITQWEDAVGSLVGSCDILFYPYGSEVDYSTEKAAFLINRGYRYLVGMWAGGDHTEVNNTYLRQTRRTVTGYILENYPDNLTSFFSTSAILDDAR